LSLEGFRKMNGTEAGSITVSFTATADEFARYAAAMKRRRSRPDHFVAFLAVFFGAIPVALISRLLWGQQSNSSGINDQVGLASLFAYMFGACVMWIAAFVVQRRATNRALTATAKTYGTRMAVLDAAGVALISPKGEARWRWAGIAGLSCEGGLLLLWVSPDSAVAIPVRSFEGAGASETAVAFIRARLSGARSASSG
jgi:hypothetical protein